MAINPIPDTRQSTVLTPTPSATNPNPQSRAGGIQVINKPSGGGGGGNRVSEQEAQRRAEAQKQAEANRQKQAEALKKFQEERASQQQKEVQRKELLRNLIIRDGKVIGITADIGNGMQSFSIDEYNKAIGRKAIVEANLGYGKKSYALEEYNKEVQRLQDILPKTKFIDPNTGNVIEKGREVKLGQVTLTSTPKVFIDPKTGQPIQDLNQYIKDNKIPLDSNGKQLTAQEFLARIKEEPTYDIQSFKNGNISIFDKSKAGYYRYFPAGEEGVTSAEPSGIVNEILKKYVVKPISMGISESLKYIEEKTNAQWIPTNLEEVRRNIKETTKFLEDIGISKKITKTGEFISGLGIGIIEDIEQEPFKQLELFGIGYGLGLAYKGISTGLSAIPKFGPIATTSFKVGATGYGLYALGKIGYETVLGIKEQEDIMKSGSILGITLKDLALTGYGFAKGEKGFDILKGEFRTRGLKELNIEQGEYPQLNPEKQLKEFEKNIIKDISENPVGFHTTGDNFFKSGIIEPKTGTSELAGLYVSTQISTPFARISGSGQGIKFELEAFLKAIKDSLDAEKNPAVASLEPLGFREVGFEYSKTPQFEGQKYVKGKGYARYTTSPKEGYLDIPKMKSEIEAIARPESGSYEATGKRFYVKIKGVKIPLDSFKYIDETIKDGIESINKETKKQIKNLKDKDLFNSENYPSYEEPTYISSIPSYGIDSFQNSISSDISSMQSSIDSSLNAPISSPYYPEASSMGSSSGKSQSSGSSKGTSSSMGSSSGKSQSSGSSKGTSSSMGSSSGKSQSSISSSIQKEYSQISQQPKIESKKESTELKGEGYYVYGKRLKGQDFFQINNTPLTQERAKDIGAYYVRQSLARTFKIKKANARASMDYEFMFIPEGYFNQVKGKLREYKIRQKQPIETPETFIEKAIFSLDTANEKKQLQEFKRMQKAILG